MGKETAITKNSTVLLKTNKFEKQNKYAMRKRKLKNN